MFLRMNRKKSCRQLREEIAGMEERLREVPAVYREAR